MRDQERVDGGGRPFPGSGTFDGLAIPPFRPALGLAGPHRQTLAGALGRTTPPRGAHVLEVPSEPGTRVRIELDLPGDGEPGCDRAPAAPRGGLVLVHGLAGGARSPNVLRTSALAVRRGLAVARVNLRNCGGTEDLGTGPFHGGVDLDARAAVAALHREAGCGRMVVAGFSLGGNVAVKAGFGAPPGVAGVVGVSPALDFAAATEAISAGGWNALYERLFIRAFGKILRRRRELGYVRFEDRDLETARTVRQLDERFTAPLAGYRDADEYYRRASAIHRLHELDVPALFLAARDDPLVPFEVFRRPAVTTHPTIRVVAPEHGGHQGFVARGPRRRWAEQLVVDATLHLLCGQEPP